jgi:hypothetical protein
VKRVRATPIVLRILAIAFLLGAAALQSRSAAASTSPASAAVAAAPLAPPASPREGPRSGEPSPSAAVVRTSRSPELQTTSAARGGGSFAEQERRDAAWARARLKPATGISLLTELTKPAYLHVRLLATPTNHRAPPV